RAASSSRDLSLSDGGIPRSLRQRAFEVVHPIEDSRRSGSDKARDNIATSKMATADKGPDRHPGGAARGNAGNAVLDHHASRRLDAHGLRRVKEEIGSRLAAGYHLAGEYPVAEEILQAG